MGKKVKLSGDGVDDKVNNELVTNRIPCPSTLPWAPSTAGFMKCLIVWVWCCLLLPRDAESPLSPCEIVSSNVLVLHFSVFKLT